MKILVGRVVEGEGWRWLGNHRAVGRSDWEWSVQEGGKVHGEKGEALTTCPSSVGWLQKQRGRNRQ